MSYLGTGYVLYFFFLKYLIVIAAMMAAFDLYKLYNYQKEGACGGVEVLGCRKDFVTVLSVANYGIEPQQLDYILWSCLMILITGSNFVAIKQAKKTDRIIDVLEDSPSDYTLMLTKVPHEDTEQVIKKYISDIKKADKQAKVSGVRAFTNFLSRLGEVDSSDDEEEDANTLNF